MNQIVCDKCKGIASPEYYEVTIIKKLIIQNEDFNYKPKIEQLCSKCNEERQN